MQKIFPGQRVTITSQGLRVTGTVLSADHETRFENGKWVVIGYLLEVLSDQGRMHYWKSLFDGGEIEIHPDLAFPEQTIEIRLRMQGDDRPWNEIPADCETRVCMDVQAGYLVLRLTLLLMQEGQQIQEVRWNWQGSLQGHYLRPGLRADQGGAHAHSL